MAKSLIFRRGLLAATIIGAFAWLGSVRASDLNPKALSFTLPKDVKWVEGANGAAVAVLVGDPTKPGLYVLLDKWHPHHNSRPHFHPNDRFIYVVSGPWWVATGSKYDLNNMVPMPAGTFVTHYGKEVHWDGAKDEECVIEIVGQGPATSTAVEETH